MACSGVGTVEGLIDHLVRHYDGSRQQISAALLSLACNDHQIRRQAAE